MNEYFTNEINVLKALAIMLVVSGHLEFSLLGIFPPYSFQIALFFFISGCLFKEKYLENTAEFVERRMYINGIPFPEYADHDVYRIYNPVQNTYLYFVITMVTTTYIGVGLKKIGYQICDLIPFNKKV